GRDPNLTGVNLAGVGSGPGQELEQRALAAAGEPDQSYAHGLAFLFVWWTEHTNIFRARAYWCVPHTRPGSPLTPHWREGSPPARRAGVRAVRAASEGSRDGRTGRDNRRRRPGGGR